MTQSVNQMAVDTIRTNIRVSLKMKEQLKEISGDLDMQQMVEILIIQYNKAWEQLGFEKMLMNSLKYQTKRKKAYDDENKEATAKDYVVALKTDRRIYDTFKSHCDELGIIFGEGVRRVLKQAIAEYATNGYNKQLAMFNSDWEKREAVEEE